MGDPYWAPPQQRPFLAEVGADPGRLRIGFTDRPWNGHAVDPECVAAVASAARLCEELGHRVEEARPEWDEPARAAAAIVIVGAHTLAHLQLRGESLGRAVRPDDVEPGAWAVAEIGRKNGAADYARAIRVVHGAGRAVGRFFTQWDALLTPTMCSPPHPLGVLSLSAREAGPLASPAGGLHGAVQRVREPGHVRSAALDAGRSAGGRAVRGTVRGRGGPVPAGGAARARPTLGAEAAPVATELVMTQKNQQILLARRPSGAVDERDFRLVETDVPQPAEGQFLVRNLFLSLDPYMRGRMSDAKSYAKPAEVGEVMVGGAVGEVVASRHPKFKPGDKVRTRNIHPGTHTRLPRYCRDKPGTIVRLHGAHVFPDSNAIGKGEDPQWLYTVRFEARELWGPDTTASAVHADLFEPYLKPAPK